MHTTPLIHITRGAWNWRSAQNLYASLYIFGRRRKKTKQMRERKRQRQRGIETEKVFPFLFTRWQEDKSMPVPRAAYSFPPTPSHSHTYTQENAPKQHKLTMDNSKWNNGCTEDPYEGNDLFLTEICVLKELTCMEEKSQQMKGVHSTWLTKPVL